MSPRRSVAAGALAAAFAALAALVAVGALTGVDQYATRHLMPELNPRASTAPTLVSALKPVGRNVSTSELAADAWLYPASVPVSFLVVAACVALAWRRGRRRAALVWAAAWVAANAVELLVKDVVHRPALYGYVGHARYHVLAFDNSFPSGHTLRSIVAAAAVAAVAPRLGRIGFAYAAVVAPLLVVAGWHTPSDVVGGALLAGTIVAAAHLLRARLGPVR